MSGLSYGSLADLLAFEAWPEEMQRIARAAVADECDEPHEDLLEDARNEGTDEQKSLDQGQFEIVRERLDEIGIILTAAKDRLAPWLADHEELVESVHGSIEEALRQLAAIPEKLADVKEPEA